MKLIKELTDEHFQSQFSLHRDVKYFGKNFQYRYRVALTKSEYLNLGINSSPLVPYPEKGKYPCLNDAITQFMDDPNLLNDAHPDRGISGTTVKSYIKEFEKGNKLDNCFIRNERDDSQRENQSYYVADGMHRLTAYGVFKKLDIKDYEVEVYYSTDYEMIWLKWNY